MLEGELRLVSGDTLNATVSWNAVAKAVVGQVLGVEVAVSQTQHANAVLSRSLDAANHILEDVDGVELGLAVPVLLLVDLTV